jgi:thiol-disulfide isomerase/thioredoxin
MNSLGFARSALGRASALLTFILLVGCSRPPSPPTSSAPTVEPPNAAAISKLDLRPVDRKGLDAVIAGHKGKVVLVDYWATWCLPCVEQLPHTFELAGKYRDRGLDVITVSCDEPSDASRVAEFLSTKGADGATNLISQFGGSSRTMEEFEIASGAVPYNALYDRSGQMRKTFGIDPAAKTPFSPAEIEAAVAELLAE